VLAAAGLVALEQMVGRLHEDHARARRLAVALAEEPGVELDPSFISTNILVFTLQPVALPGNVAPAARFVAGLLERGVACGAFSDREVRMVTHCDVDDDGIEQAIRAARATLAEMYGKR